MAELDVIVAVPSDAGWEPIRKMAQLLCSYLDSEPIYVDVHKSLQKSAKIIGAFPRLKKGKKKVLVIAYDPGQLYAISQVGIFSRLYSEIYGWVIDSFWAERIPRIASTGIYNHIFVTDPGDIDEWQKAGVASVSALTWGADIWSNIDQRLDIHKTNDLLRVGRQPRDWEDDAATGDQAKELGLSFQGRPPFGNSPVESTQHLERALKDSKVVLAFTNKISPTRYTHPTKEYLTGRWIDALGWGCMVAGQIPQTKVSEKYLWPQATLEVPYDNMGEGLHKIAEKLKTIDNHYAQQQIINTLENFDWRFRFNDLLEKINRPSRMLSNDIERIKLFIEIKDFLK